MAMLDGVRVIELGTAITAPLPGMMLADYGAEVIKVEPPGGDFFRRGGGATFLAYNRGKRSVILDLKSEAGKAALSGLLAHADVLIDNYRPGVLDRLGLAADALRQRFPRLIHCSITGFGDTGPYRDRPAFDSVGQAMGGLASLFIDPDKPQAAGPTISDNVTGMYACTAVLAALVERQRTGAGRRLEVNMLESTMAFMPDAFSNYSLSGQEADRFTRVARSQSFWFRCRDGRFISIHLSTQDKNWQGLTEVLGAAELQSDPRFGDLHARVAHYAELQRALAGHFTARDRDDWLDRLRAADVPAAPILSIGETLDDPQVVALGTTVELPHPEGGSYQAIRCPVLVDGGRPLPQTRPAPKAGEHTEAVLAELAAAAKTQ